MYIRIQRFILLFSKKAKKLMATKHFVDISIDSFVADRHSYLPCRCRKIEGAVITTDNNHKQNHTYRQQQAKEEDPHCSS